MNYILLILSFVLIELGISLIESLVISWIACILGINIAFKIILFVVFIINLLLSAKRKLRRKNNESCDFMWESC